MNCSSSVFVTYCEVSAWVVAGSWVLIEYAMGIGSLDTPDWSVSFKYSSSVCLLAKSIRTPAGTNVLTTSW